MAKGKIPPQFQKQVGQKAPTGKTTGKTATKHPPVNSKAPNQGGGGGASKMPC